jgi:hypothetical protein
MKRTLAVVSRLGCLALTLGLGTADWLSAQDRPPTTSPCSAVAGAEQVLVPGAVVILSDVPGTEEVPQFASALACQSLASGKPVTLALDLPREERSAVDAFLASDGSPAARDRLLAAPSWRRESASLARLELLEWVRTARAAGKPIWVTLLDTDELPARSASTEREREHRMATALALAVDTTPHSVVIGLVGNPHARLVRDTSVNPPYPPMSYLVERELRQQAVVYALDAVFPSGEAWRCAAGGESACGPAAVTGRGEHGEPFRVVLGGDVDRAFNGSYQLPSLTASPPALPARNLPAGSAPPALTSARR